MHFALVVLASLVAGALAAHVPPTTPWDDALKAVINEFPQQVAAQSLDPITLPNIEFTVGPTKVVLTEGQATGLGRAVEPHGRCTVGSELTCYVSFDGLRITYQAMVADTQEKFPVEVYTQLSMIEVTLTKEPKPVLRETRVVEAFLFVRKADFSQEPEKAIAFDNELRLNLHSVLVGAPALRSAFHKAFAKAVSEVAFPTA